MSDEQPERSIQKKLTRSTSDRWIAGVAGGMADYFGLDPTVMRIIFIVLGLITTGFPVLIAYIIMWVVIPEDTAA
ncbi:MAG: PspC domain-containing protein [Chloroflexi bacterium]|nr:PspC domain-containing protein [Chloroflexota bacterium]